MVFDQQLVEDIVQEIWIEITKGISSFKNESKLSTWIYTIAKRVIHKHCQKEKIYTMQYLSSQFHGDTFEIPQDHDLDKHIWVKEMCDKCLVGILHTLSEEDRFLYLLRDIVELSYATIADINQLTEPTVRKRLSRIRKKLNDFLTDECALANPNAIKRCRMRDHVEDIDLQSEYTKIRSLKKEINVFEISNKVLPHKKYWLQYL